MEQAVTTFLRFHKQNRPLTHVLFWGAVYGLGWFEMRYNLGLSPAESGREIAWLMLNRIPMAYLLVYVLVPQFFQRQRYWTAIALFLMGCYGLYVVSTLVRPYQFDESSVGSAEWVSVLTDIPFFFEKYILSHIGAGMLVLLIKLLLNQAEAQRKALTLEKQKAELELKLLKTQLNPHFLFNTLNNIYALSVLQSPQAPQAIARLSEILDYILYRCNTDRVPLSSEITLLENYISLEKLRYDARLEVAFTKHIEHEVSIAPLILLTIVENAFKHGASEDSGTPHIYLDLTAIADLFMFRVTNTYIETQAVVTREKIGLANVRHQLDLVYADCYALEIEAKAGTFVVELRIKKPSI